MRFLQKYKDTRIEESGERKDIDDYSVEWTPEETRQELTHDPVTVGTWHELLLDGQRTKIFLDRDIVLADATEPRLEVLAKHERDVRDKLDNLIALFHGDKLTYVLASRHGLVDRKKVKKFKVSFRAFLLGASIRYRVDRGRIFQKLALSQFAVLSKREVPLNLSFDHELLNDTASRTGTVEPFI